jgi:hypothetical protein
MKKLVILPMIAAAALGLAACKWGTSATAPDNGSVANESGLNVEDANTTAPEDTILNETVTDNATVIDNASNATAK